MTTLQVLTRSGAVYVECLKYETAQEACDVALKLLQKGYGVNMSVDGRLNDHTISEKDEIPLDKNSSPG